MSSRRDRDADFRHAQRGGFNYNYSGGGTTLNNNSSSLQKNDKRNNSSSSSSSSSSVTHQQPPPGGVNDINSYVNFFHKHAAERDRQYTAPGQGGRPPNGATEIGGGPVVRREKVHYINILYLRLL